MSTQQSPPRHILITGASRGLGRALALHYAQVEQVHRLSLMGRDQASLEETATQCRAHGAMVDWAALDVTDHSGMADWIAARDAEHPVSHVIAAAGLGGQKAIAEPWGESGAQARALIETNTMGVINTIAPLQRAMASRGAGHIVLIGSIQGAIGLPQSPAYSASKAALKIYADAMRRLLRPKGVGVTMALPGFIDTDMSRSLSMARPWCWSAEKAAARIARDVARGARYSIFPWQLRLAVALGAAAPAALSDLVLSHSLKFASLTPRAAPGPDDDKTRR